MKSVKLFIVLGLIFLFINTFGEDPEVLSETVYRPYTVGINEEKFSDAIMKVLNYSSDIRNICIVKDDKVIFDATSYPYKNDEPHAIMSCTKSITSMLMGIAIDEGYIKDVNEPLYKWYPEIKSDPDQSKLTLYHLLTMTTGVKWNEDGSYSGSTDSYVQMLGQEDPAAFFFSKDIDFKPGTHFQYNSGATAIMGFIIEKATELSLYDYAKTRLFEPLGISDFEWKTFRNGTCNAGSSLYLSARDMAKLGLLMMKNGKWNEKQIVPEEWVKESIKPYKRSPNNAAGYYGYGLSWWINPKTGSYHAKGFGGQFIMVYPEQNLVISTNSSLYGNDFFNPVRMLGEGVVKSLDDALRDDQAIQDCYDKFAEKEIKDFGVEEKEIEFLGKQYKFQNDVIFRLSQSQQKDMFQLEMLINGNDIKTELPKDGTYVLVNFGTFGSFDENLAMFAIEKLTENRFTLIYRRYKNACVNRFALTFNGERATWQSFVNSRRYAYEDYTGYLLK